MPVEEHIIGGMELNTQRFNRKKKRWNF